MALESLFDLDKAVLFFINKGLANPLFDFIFKFTQLLPYVFWVLLILFFMYKRKNQLAVLMIIGLTLSLLTVAILKNAVARERPYQVLDVRQLVPEENNTSFPSSHVQLSFLLSTIVFAFYRKLGIGLYVLSLFIAIGRIYLGVHYPSDVLDGAIIGVLLGSLILLLKEKFYKPRIKAH